MSRRNSLERVLYRSAEWQQTGKASLSIPASTSSAATPGSQDMLRRMRVPELDAITLFMAPDNASSESASKLPAWLSRAVLISWGQPIHRPQELVAARQWRFKSSLPHINGISR